MQRRGWTANQIVILATLTAGYAGYYVCRSNLSVSASMIIEDSGGKIDRDSFGIIVSSGTIAYAAGKVINGMVGDFLGGRLMFLIAMLLSVAATVGFGLSTGLAAFIGFWCCNRFVQSAGWGAAVKVCSNWFAPDQYGRAMAILALSYLFGDVIARLGLGQLIKLGFTWQQLFFAAAATLGFLAILGFLLLRTRPEDAGEAPIDPGQASVFGERSAEERPRSVMDLLGPFVKSPAFWMVCVMSLGLTMIREVFNNWSPLYLEQEVRMSKGDAASWSSLFPLFGGFSVLVTGFLSDTVAKGKRGAVMTAFLLPLAAGMAALAMINPASGQTWPLVLLSAVAFSLIGPYAFLSGALSLDLGSKKGSATAAGMADAVGYLGGVLSGWGFAWLIKTENGGSFSKGFVVLAGIALASAFAALIYWRFCEKRAPKTTT